MGGAPALVERIEREGWEAIAETQVIGFGSRCIYQSMASQALADKGIATFTDMAFDSTEMTQTDDDVRNGSFLTAVNLR